MERFDTDRVVGVVSKILERDTKGADQGHGGLKGFGMEDLKGEDEVLDRVGEWEGETLVPYRAGRANVV